MNIKDKEVEQEQQVEAVSEAIECRHIYHVAPGTVTIRYCETCGMSWVLDGSYGWHWTTVEEPQQ